GNDLYEVDDAGDVVTEASGAGTDTVQAGVRFVLGAHVAKLTPTRIAKINSTRNKLAHVLTGKAGNKTPRGAGRGGAPECGARERTPCRAAPATTSISSPMPATR